MPITLFPDPRNAVGPEGIVGFGGDLEPETLLQAYRQGIYPWPVEGLPLAWFCPPQRAILEFSELHVPRSLARARRRGTYEFTIDRAFDDVICACADVERPGQPGTWITEPMIRAYIRFHELGHAHSVEAWDEGELVGGLYGVDVDGAFAGESMFHLKPDASKLAILHLVDHLRARGLDWFDIQMVTPHMQRLGARAISRDAFLEKLARTRALSRKVF